MNTAFQIRHAVHILRGGGIIIYPTDTVYGLGCDPYDPDAVRRIAAIKQRPPGKSMILLASDNEQLAGITDRYRDISRDPAQPTTWIVPASSTCPAWLCAEDNSIAVRITDHPVVTSLCEGLRSPIISTSANLSGRRPATGRLAMAQTFRGMVDAVLIDDSRSTGKPSTIRYLDDQRTVRP